MSVYDIWYGIKRRCYNPDSEDYPNYGGRGIKMHDAWKDNFSRFEADIGPRPSEAHTLDRVNNDRHYEPLNVRWALPGEQVANRSSTVRLTANGRTQTLAEWAIETGTPYRILWRRYQRGWDPERIVNTPNARAERANVVKRAAVNEAIEKELDFAIQNFPPMRSPHEGYAILAEEVDELWTEVKRKGFDPADLKKEAVQVAAMAIRFLMDVCP